MEKSGFFNAMKVGDTWDRVYKAENYAEYFATFIGNGVFPNPAKQLQVLETDRMNVIIKSGKAWINGYRYENTDDLIVPIDTADGVLHRIDKVVLRYDVEKREIRACVKKGEFSSTPTAPELTRNADMYELALADIRVSAGAIKVSQADITDLRLNKELCGIVHGVVDQVDTTAIFNQFQSWYTQTKEAYDKNIAMWTKDKKEAFDKWYKESTKDFLKQWNEWFNPNTTKWEKDFNSWFDTLKDKLDGNIAAKLTKDVDQLKEDTKSQLDNITKFNRKTYEELKSLKDSKKLKQGSYYMLTDYKTKYLQPATKVIKEAKETEELILFAVSEDKFASQVYSTKYPQDIIHYDIGYSMCEDRNTPRPGFILRRHDTNTGNICPYDFRNMLWARWYPDENQYYKDDKLVDYEVWTEGEVKLDVLYKADNQLLLAKKAGTPESATDSNYFVPVYTDTQIACLINYKTKTFNKGVKLKRGELQERLTFGKNCSNNTFGRWCHNNVLGDGCYNNTFGHSCSYNTFGVNCTHNILGNTCYTNYFEKGCNSTMFGNNCDENIFGTNCYYNNFGNNCEGNILGAACCNNTFGNSCTDNVFGCDCDANTINNACYKNTFDRSCTHNTFGNDCYDNTFGKGCYGNDFQNDCSGNIFANDCHSNSFGTYCFNNTFDKVCYYNTFGNGCSRNNFDFNSFYNSFGDKCYSNVLGHGCHSNIFYNNCFNNTFTANSKYITIKYLQNKNLENLSEINDKEFSITITRGKDSNYYYHFYNGSSEEYYQIP